MNFASEQGFGVGFREFSLSILRVNPAIKINGLSVGAPEKSLALSSTDIEATLSWSQLFAEEPVVDDVVVSQATLLMDVDEKGRSNWDELIDVAKTLSAQNNSSTLPFVDLRFRDTKVKYTNVFLGHDGNFDLEGDISLLTDKEEASIELNGDINDYSTRFLLLLGLADKQSRVARKDQQIPDAIPVSLDVQIADMQLVVNARLDSVQTPGAIAGSLQTMGQHASSTLHELNLISTDVSEFSGKLIFSAIDDVYRVADVNIELGDSQLVGSLEIDDREKPIRISGEFASSALSIDEMLGVQSTPLELPVSNDASKRGTKERLFSTAPFSQNAWLSDLEGALDVQFSRITRGATNINDLSLLARFSDGISTLTVQSDEFADGNLSLIATIDSSDDDVVGSHSAKLELTLQHVQLLDALLPDSTAGASKGSVSGEGTFWASGFSASTLASSVDGGMFLVIEDGELDSMMVEMAGIDLMESIRLLIKRDLQQTAIRCGYADVQAESGVVDIQDFIIDTEDSLFLLKGGINLNDETVSLKFEPHPRDASFLAAPTALVVSGTLASPTFKPGRSLYSRIAVAGALAALTGPAAIVLPFIEIGRGGEPSNCSELFSQ